MKKQKFLVIVLILSASLGLMASMFFGLTSCSKQPATDIIPGTVSFDDGWRFLKDSLSGPENPDIFDIQS
ncbi:MAG: hypothetical protein A2V50_00615 [Bacteroidetes bacterium RBG_19FT_COMBO_42_10]|nr:MAG: hypothetical protein A2V50_00615 [Bacteroidetes bacterium RBG_19FT_COMBO_42_10]